MVMVSCSRWGSFFDVVDSGLRVKLIELWIKNSKPPVPKRRSCRIRVWFWMLGLLDFEFGLLNGRHFDVVRLEEDA